MDKEVKTGLVIMTVFTIGAEPGIMHQTIELVGGALGAEQIQGAPQARAATESVVSAVTSVATSAAISSAWR